MAYDDTIEIEFEEERRVIASVSFLVLEQEHHFDWYQGSIPTFENGSQKRPLRLVIAGGASLCKNSIISAPRFLLPFL